jgi:hypothetical protein
MTITRPGFEESGDQPRFAISAATALSMAAPPARMFPGTRTANSAQLNWNVFWAAGDPDAGDVVTAAEPRPTIMSAKNKSA